jgi:YHS domain-containing protein
MKNTRTLLAILIALLVINVVLSCAQRAESLPQINMTEDGVAIKGYDPVAYFTLGEPTRGSAEFEHTWMGAKWRFANAAHLELFKSNPGKFAPQYGGY